MDLYKYTQIAWVLAVKDWPEWQHSWIAKHFLCPAMAATFGVDHSTQIWVPSLNPSVPYIDDMLGPLYEPPWCRDGPKSSRAAAQRIETRKLKLTWLVEMAAGLRQTFARHKSRTHVMERWLRAALSLLNCGKSNPNQIVFTVFRLIWNPQIAWILLSDKSLFWIFTSLIIIRLYLLFSKMIWNQK